MSRLFDDLIALDRKLANRWKIRTRDNASHILTRADIDFILADLISSIALCLGAIGRTEAPVTFTEPSGKSISGFAAHLALQWVAADPSAMERMDSLVRFSQSIAEAVNCWSSN